MSVSFLVSAPEMTMQRYLEITSWATFLTGVHGTRTAVDSANLVAYQSVDLGFVTDNCQSGERCRDEGSLLQALSLSC